MRPVERLRWTEEEYLEQERHSETKHEFVNGEIIAMAGASYLHNVIASNVLGALRALLQAKPYQALGSDQRIHVEATGMYTYPDVSVVCGRPLFHDKDPKSLKNPLLIVEVLSESTEDYDRGAKFAHYRSIPSLQEVLLVAQTEHRIDYYRRLDTGQWLLTEYKSGGVPLEALGCELPLAEVYAKLDLIQGEPSA